MESNGKNVNRANKLVNYNTGPIVWGAPAPMASTRFSSWCTRHTADPTDFLVAAVNPTPWPTSTNGCWPTAGADRGLLKGKSRAVAGRTDRPGMGPREAKHSHRTRSSRQPPQQHPAVSEARPAYAGMLLALYEHKVFVQGVIWQINS